MKRFPLVLITSGFLYLILTSCGPNSSESLKNAPNKPLLTDYQSILNEFYYYSKEEMSLMNIKKDNKEPIQKTIVKRPHSKEIYFYDNNKNAVLKQAISLSSDTSRTYFYYNKEGYPYLQIYISSNNYDTTYTYRKYNENALVINEIYYNITRDEFSHYILRDSIELSNNNLRLTEIYYHQDLDAKAILPFLHERISYSLNEDRKVNLEIERISYKDSVKRDFSFNYILTEDFLLKDPDHKISYDQNGNWYEILDEGNTFSRTFESENSYEIPKAPVVDSKIIQFLDSLGTNIPRNAWNNYLLQNEALHQKKSAISKDDYGYEIELDSAEELNSFTPKLWHLVTYDSGLVDGMENPIVVAGYNTPIAEDHSYKRALAIYEVKGGKYHLLEQSMHAISSFIDYDNDYTFTDWDETNFEIILNNNSVTVFYTYMRGEAAYILKRDTLGWYLANFGNSGRTCCEASSYEIDFINSKVVSSNYSTIEEGEEEKKDTTITTVLDHKLPRIYIDSITSRPVNFYVNDSN